MFARADKVKNPGKETKDSPLLNQLIDFAKENLPKAEAGFKYHNWEHHVQPMLIIANKLCDRCEAKGLSLERDVVIAAVLLHDILFHKDPKEYGAENPEQLAAISAYNHLIDLGATEEFAGKVRGAIQDTYVAVEPKSLEGRIMRAADLHRVGLSYETFITDAKLLHEESKFGLKNESTFEDFFPKAMSFLSLYLAYDIKLTEKTPGSEWHKRSLQHIIKGFQEVFDKDLRVLVDLTTPSNRDISTLNLLAKDSGLVTTVGSDSREIIAKLKKDMSSKHTFSLPGTSSCAPIPDNIAETVFIAYPQDISEIKEAQRMMKKRGRILIEGTQKELKELLAFAVNHLNFRLSSYSVEGKTLVQLIHEH